MKVRVERRSRRWVTVGLGLLLAAACFYAGFAAMHALGDLVGSG